MANSSKRKTVLVLALAGSLVLALGAIITDDDLRERLGPRYYILSLAMIGCVLLVLAGYVWDCSLQQRLKTLRSSLPRSDDMDSDPADHDEIIGLARNIERMAQSLQQSEASYRGIVEDQIDLICRYRADATLTFVNRAYAEAVGRKRQELVGQPFQLLAPALRAQGEAPQHESEVEFADGSRHWLLWTIRAIRDRAGDILEYQAVGHDISVRKEAEAAALHAKEAAELADRAKSEFLAIVSHEIRTPINGVLGFAQILADSPLTPEQREQVAIIRSSAQALESLIADILDLSKIGAGTLEIESSPFGLHRCIEEVIAFFQPKARAAGLTLNFAIDRDVPAIIASDEARIRQILTNLVGNALKFTEHGGVSVRVSCARESERLPTAQQAVRVFFAICDTGVGIPADKLHELFKPFSQVDASSKRRRNGTGLGLIISKRLCELMGGSISVESTPGRGSTFHVSVLAEYQKGDTLPPFAPRQSVPSAAS